MRYTTATIPGHYEAHDGSEWYPTKREGMYRSKQGRLRSMDYLVETYGEMAWVEPVEVPALQF